ncbi:unnamed protein product [Moneuplotes crassus]|uniref:RING-type domain-containing protein n=1 Tax=Euplotes crassus TaxID=5936 RepID=A0AAD1UN04_EUPCR|nr:unnamed protein product [Moneuplotes crassus]
MEVYCYRCLKISKQRVSDYQYENQCIRCCYCLSDFIEVTDERLDRVVQEPIREHISIQTLSDHLENKDYDGLKQYVVDYELNKENLTESENDNLCERKSEESSEDNNDKNNESFGIDPASLESFEASHNHEESSNQSHESQNILPYNINPFGELNRLIRTITPNRIDENRIERRQETQQRYTFGNNWVLDENSENESESDGTTLRFERTIAVSIDAPNAELLSQDQFLRLQEIFEEAFDFQNFVTNFSQSFSRIDQILENELGNMSINAQNRQVPTQEAIDELPQVTLSKRHCKWIPNSGEYECPNCVICISEISIGIEAIFMPCGHIFHKECLLQWFQNNHKCPTCRLELPTS